MTNIVLEPYIDAMDMVIRTNKKIVETQIILKNKLLKRNVEQELLLHQKQGLRSCHGKRAN